MSPPDSSPIQGEERKPRLTVREITEDEAQLGRWGLHRFLVCHVDEPEVVVFPRGMLGLVAAGADHFDAALEDLDYYERRRGYEVIRPTLEEATR